MIRFVVALALAVPFASLANCEEEVSLRKLVANDPSKLAGGAISIGDLKFLGVAGYSVTVPGVDSKKCSARRELVRVLGGTSDTPCDIKLQEAARDFARTYNLIIKAQLDAKRVNHEHCAP